MLRSAITALLALSLSFSGQAFAQSTGNIQVDPFEPQYGQGTAILNTLKTDIVPHLKPTAGLFFHLSNGVAEERTVDGDGNETANTLIGNSYKLELQLGLGLLDLFDIGVMVPLVLSQDTGTSQTLNSSLIGDFTVQDPRIGLRVRLLDPNIMYGFGIALSANIYIPTGSKSEYTFASDADVRVEPRLILDYRHSDSQFAIAANIGLQIRPERSLGNVVNGYGLRWYLGTEIPLGVDGLHLIGSAYGTFGLSDDRNPQNLGQKADEAYNSPVELDAGIQYAFYDYDLVFNAGGGAGLVSALGAPAWRVFASVSFTPMMRDQDEDGIQDSSDKCPKEPEDRDSFQDEDGCPDVDNDGDGIVDAKDKCPLKPEDKDNFEDSDGCPDPDNDRDGVLDVDDKCPLKPEDKDGFEDKDGCPDPDNDRDDILDVNDKCPNNPEDKDGYEDTDGCPDPDNDGDGVLDVDDKCPLSPETKNEFQDEDGCPDTKPKKNAKVQVTARYVTIKGKIQFATAKAKIKKKSFKLLNEVVDVLKGYAQITKLRIEGHTDDRGPDEYNRKLSDRRAKAVRTYLVNAGIDAKRLDAIGYGEARPKLPNTSRKNRAVNRRVEFFILEIDGKPVGKDANVRE